MTIIRFQQRQTPLAFRLRVGVVAGLGLAAVALLFSWPPLPQRPSYHDFADQRPLLGVPHGLNVLSNLPFLLVGGLGLWFCLRGEGARAGKSFETPAERWPYVLFFLGVGLTAFGSAYYHMEPNNDRLLWDRLPMSVAFMALFASVLAERVSRRVGLALLAPLVALGIGSVLYWHWTEAQGRGDLRPYYVVQFYPLLALPPLLLLFPPRYTRTADLVAALGWYVLAKFCEDPLDAAFYALGGWVSGHTLKHLLAALGASWILHMIAKRLSVAR
jgi:hypothetical protein